MVLGKPEIDESVGGEVASFVGGAARRFMNDTFGALKGEGCGFVKAFNEPKCRADRVGVFCDCVYQAEAVGLLGAEALSRGHHLHGSTEADVSH